MNMGVGEIPTAPADLFQRVERGERIVLEQNGKPVAAIVSLSDLNVLEELEEMEDQEDARAVEEALAEMERTGEKPIPWKQVKEELGL